jgi:hypothetical protein
MTCRKDDGELENRNLYKKLGSCEFSLLALKSLSRAKATEMTGQCHFDI